MNKLKLPRVYYGYKLLKKMWERQPDTNPDKAFMIQSLTESMKEIVDQYMIDFEQSLEKESA